MVIPGTVLRAHTGQQRLHHRQAFQALRMGYASALAWLLFVIIMVITAIQVKVGNKLVYYEGGQK